MDNEYLIFAVITSLIIGFSLFAKRIQRFNISGPMFMLFFGVSFAYFVPIKDATSFDMSSFQLFIELTLALILFSDAAKTNLSVLKHSYAYPLLLLLIAMPLTFGFGIAIGVAVFPSEPLIHLALIAIILTPTDAALSNQFIENQTIPEQTREAVNVESGLNDGLAVPVFLLLIYAAISKTAPEPVSALGLVISEVGIAIIVATVLSVLTFKLILYAEKHGFHSEQSEIFIFVTVAILVFLVAQMLGGSGFFAAFIAGLVFDFKFRETMTSERLTNASALGNTCALIIWFVFGYFAFGHLSHGMSITLVLYALCALTVMRMVPVLISLLFTKLPFKQRVLLAWFGPRGLASVVFTLILLQQLNTVSEQLIRVAFLTIIMSVILHGFSSRIK